MTHPVPSRDLIGYGRHPMVVQLPGGANIAINFVINYEEGAERTPVNGDAMAENYGHDLASNQALMQRSLSNESLFEYGSRCGIWRLTDLFDKHNIPVTFFTCGYALMLNPILSEYLTDTHHEVAGHGWRWINHAGMNIDEERESIRQTIDIIRERTGKTPCGWYTGRKSNNTRQLLTEFDNIIYDSDAYADDLPYFVEVKGKEHLIVPYTLDCNDFGFVSPNGFVTGEQFFDYLVAAYQTLSSEGKSGVPKMMTIALHPRISGRPGRFDGVRRFVEFISGRPDTWLTRREDIAHLWWQMATS
ncbi:Peptidoglycan deacetylase [BD1-7 clade bacterium]|uniref:Peptidoglycan deacetylase n=1 Tax=BD1-7 clade bacterium TaxID=2029982 RepID=A0A5S9R120_9GAMM|nr:Peptidoglycan deacetylase [BD1-7 clade bacterium]